MTIKVSVAPTSQSIRSLRVHENRAWGAPESPTLLKQATTRVFSVVAGPGTVSTATSYKPGKWDIYFLGLTIVIGGQYFCWNAGIAAGLFSYFIAYLLIGTAYIALCCCTAEITGALPFAGGSYGLARCTLGFYPAFMIGCCEALEYIAYVSASTIAFVDLVVDTAPELKAYRPLLWGIFYLSALVFHIKGGRAFWMFNFVLGVVSLLIVVLYCIGSFPFVSYAKYANDVDMQFVDDFPGFMKALPLAAWFFVGVEALPMASDQIEHAKHIVPIAQVGCVVTLFVTGMFVYFVTASLPPGLAALPAEMVPFNNGFTLMLNIPRRAATVLSWPATFATAFGFMWCYGKLIVAMAMSKLLPSFLSKTTTAHETPYAALIAGTSVSYALCLGVYCVPSIGQYLFNICMLSGFMSYTGQCIGRTLVQPLTSSTIRILPSGEKKTARLAPTGPSADNTLKYRHGKLDIFMLGITIVIGGQYFCWNEGINAGIYSFFIAYVLIAAAYITLCCCTAEITGALPFAGGSYGLARCTLGFYPAFMIGCCEALEYIAYVSASVISFVDLIVDSAPSLDAFSPLLWALFYLSALCLQIRGGHVFWIFNLGIAVVSLLVVVIYCVGSLAFVDFPEYGADSNFEFVDGFQGFMKALPLAAWFFVGVEALSLSSDQVDQPKKIVPIAQVSCVVTLFATGLVVYFVTASLPPGLAVLPTELVPFNRGFTLMFKIPHRVATVLSLPATYATAFGFMWCYGKLIVAMAMSRLLPKFLSKMTKENETPYGALLAGSAISYALCIISYFVPAVGKNLFRICILSAFMSYSGQCVGYISLKFNYRNIKSSEFQSPFGIGGAVFSMVIWVVAIVGVVAFQNNGGVEIMTFSIICTLLTAFYFGYARKRQTFSAAENRVMLVAHVTKFNVKKVAAGRRVRLHKTSSNSKRTGGGTETSQTDNGKLVLRSAKSAMHSPSREKVEDSRDAQPPTGPSTSTTTITTTTKYKPGKLDIFMLGITIVIGGQYFCWNEGINAGIYSFLFGFFLIASAYTTLCCCTAEITGALPFAGGSYGLARCTLGFYPAFMIGCCEALEYIAYVSASVISFVNLIVDVAPFLKSISPVLWALFYTSALAIQIKGGRVFWIFNLCIGAISLVVAVIYCLGSFAFVDFAEYGADPKLEFVDSFHGFMKALPLTAWFFVGVEALSLSSDQVEQPKKIVPIAQVSCVVTLFVSGLVIYFVTTSLPPGLAALPTELVPFNRGFRLMFNLSHQSATVLSLPATYATAFGFMWCYGKLIVAMAMSKLLPAFLSKTTKENESPYGALLAGSIVSYLLCIISYFEPDVGANLFRICVLSAFMSYTGQCIGYISLKRNYRNIKSSEFRSPFGIAGAAYSMVIWILAIIAVVAFQDNGGVEIIAFGVTVAILTMFYHGYSRKRQTFSAAENRVMLVAHVTKFNVSKVVAGKQKRGTKKNNSNSKHTGGTDTSHTEVNSKWGVVTSRIATKSANSTANPSIREAKEASGPIDPHLHTPFHPGKLDIYLLGISIAIGGRYFGWNSGDSATYVSAGVLTFTALAEAIPAIMNYRPLLWAVFYLTALVPNIKCGRAFGLLTAV
ncbi:unnamed protein product [Phytophthora fragariaefolia]|uniref:Unnamed protein product n=1 Tax=Phytophthora fragariaefolia TaxID=1490495 RepID=A0A9W6XM43_9STRA|nr:unnamed protein product [Phytophthora fragariaefolia]